MLRFGCIVLPAAVPCIIVNFPSLWLFQASTCTASLCMYVLIVPYSTREKRQLGDTSKRVNAKIHSNRAIVAKKKKKKIMYRYEYQVLLLLATQSALTTQ